MLQVEQGLCRARLSPPWFIPLLMNPSVNESLNVRSYYLFGVSCCIKEETYRTYLLFLVMLYLVPKA